MWIIMDAHLREQKERFKLKYSCEDCAHFGGEDKQCAMLYPTAPHREQSFLRAEDGERIYFCKMFEVDDA